MKNQEGLSFGKRNNAHISKIQSAGASQTMLAIKYKDRKGNLSQRVVEPYKLIGNDFWAFDPEKENIRRFKIKNFKSIKSTNKKYEARWPIEIGGMEMIKTSEFMDSLIEKTSSDKKNTDEAMASLGTASALTGTALVADSIKDVDKNKLSGTKEYWHNTSGDAVKSINEKGLLNSKAVDKDNLTNIVLGDRIKAGHINKEDIKGKVYMAKTKEYAESAGRKRAQVKGENFKTSKTLKVRLSDEDMKKLNPVANPEMLGAKGFDDYYDKVKKVMLKENIDRTPQHMRSPDFITSLKNQISRIDKGQFKSDYDFLNDSVTVNSDVASKYIKGGKGYRRNVAKNVVKNIVKNPKKSMGAIGPRVVGGTVIGVTGAGMTAKALHNAVKAGKKDDNMIKTSEFMDYLIEKVAGVEYGYNVYSDKSGKLSDQLSQSSLSGDYDKEESIRGKLKMKGPNDYGFPKWSEKTMASVPFEYDVTELTDFMNGKNTNKLKDYRPMLSPYSGKDDGQNFLAGRESAEKMVKMYGNLLSKMPEGEKFSKADYDKAVNKYNSFKSVIDGRRSKNEEAVKAERSKWVDSTSRLDAKKSEWDKKNPLIKMVNIPGRIRHNSEVKNIRQESNNHFLNMHKLRNKGISKEDLGQLNTLRDNMYKGSNRNTVELYRDSLANSLKDKKNNMYEWGWS